MPETVLDKSSIQGLLQMAGEEALLRDRDDYGDRYLYGLSQRSLPEWHRQQILEQVVLNSRLYSIHQIPLDWLEGEFLQEPLVEWRGIEGEARNAPPQISPEIIDGLLRARGYDIPLDQYQSRVQKAEEALAKIESYERTHLDDKVEPFKLFIQGMFNHRIRSSEAYRLARAWEDAYSSVQPLMDAVEEFACLADFAEREECYLKVPTYQLSANLINLRSSSPNESNVVQVFRFTTSKLGRFPIFSTLGEALQLAQDPATAALREQIDNWLSSLSRGTASVTEVIQKDIQRASESLQKAAQVRRAGFISGLVALPVSTIGLTSQLFSALGLALSCVAVFCEERGKAKAEGVKWAGFGSVGTRSGDS